jgi:hypothetical protein
MRVVPGSKGWYEYCGIVSYSAESIQKAVPFDEDFGDGGGTCTSTALSYLGLNSTVSGQS